MQNPIIKMSYEIKGFAMVAVELNLHITFVFLIWGMKFTGAQTQHIIGEVMIFMA
jgi:hypothetical protein